jgi:uncharacterized membrane protein
MPRTLALAALGGVCHIGAAAAQTYSYVSITVPNATYTTVAAVNSKGTVVGNWYDASFTEHGFVYAGGTVTTFDYPGAANGTAAASINTQGMIVGTYYDSNYVPHGFTYTVTKKGNPVFTDVDAPGSNGTTLSAVDNKGALFGGGVGSGNASYVFSDVGGVFTTLVSANGPAVLASSGNGNLGGAYFATYPSTGWVYAKGVLTNLPTTGYTSTTTYGVNAKGIAVGSATSTAGLTTGFTFGKGKLKAVAVPGATTSYFTGINASGMIVGVAVDSSNNLSSFLYAGGTFTTLAVPDGTSTYATAINSAGQVIGTYTDANFNQDVFLATPAN